MSKKNLSTILLAIITSVLGSSIIYAQDTTNPQQESINKLSLETSEDSYIMSATLPNALKNSTYIFEAKPGDTVSTKIFTKNTSIKDWLFEYYTVDTKKNKDGVLVANSKKDEKTTVSTWSQVLPNKLSLKSKEQEELTLTITIPEETSSQEYIGAFIMEREPITAKNNAGIRIATRIANFIYLTVTDYPFTIPLAAKVYIHPSFWTLFITKYYFWVSLALFIGSIILLSYSSFKEKKAKR